MGPVPAARVNHGVTRAVDFCALRVPNLRLAFDRGARALVDRVSFAGITQLVECKLPKLDVAGSNPVSRSGAALGVSAGASSVFSLGPRGSGPMSSFAPMLSVMSKVSVDVW